MSEKVVGLPQTNEMGGQRPPFQSESFEHNLAFSLAAFEN